MRFSQEHTRPSLAVCGVPKTEDRRGSGVVCDLLKLLRSKTCVVPRMSVPLNLKKCASFEFLCGETSFRLRVEREGVSHATCAFAV